MAHVCLRVTDLDRTLKFYRDGIGLKPHFNFTRKGKPIGFYLEVAKGAYVEVFETNDPIGEGKRSLDHFCIETDAMESLRERLIQHGYSPGESKLGADQSHQFWIKDPDGVAIEFHQYTPESAQLTGRDVEVNW